MNQINNRDIAKDWIKGFLIVCVVLGHTMRVGSCADILDKIVLQGIYGFHMPLFMLLAGYFFKIDEPLKMIKKTFLRVIVPYIVASIMFGVVYFLQGRSLLDVIYSIGLGYANGALWFLYALAIIQIIIAIAIWSGRMRLGKGLVIPICAVLFTLALYSPIRCDLWMLFYFGSGLLLARYKDLFPSGIVGVLGCVGLIWYGCPWYTKLCIPTIGLSLFALMVLHSIALKASSVKGVKFFSWIGRHTMVILIFHPLFNTAYKLLMRPILSIDGSGVLFFFSSAFFAICGCILLEFALKKCCVGWLFGLR